MLDSITVENVSPKVIFLGDTHFGARNDSLIFHDFFEQFFKFLFNYMDAHGINTIVQFGDLFDRRKYVNFVTLKRCREYFFDECKKRGYEVFAFLGNHDVSYKNTLDVASPVLLLQGYYDNVHILNKPTELQMGNTKMLCIPWICSENYDECLEAINKTDAQLCLGHFEMQGFEMYKGSFCDHGLSPDLFWKFHHVYSGHFHHISSRGNITYIGSPYQIMWSDYGDERGAFVLDTATRDVEFVANPYQMFYKLYYDDSKFDIHQLDDMDFSDYNSRYVKLIVQNKNDLYLYDRFIEKLSMAGAIVTPVDDHKYHNLESDEEIFEEVEDINDFLKKSAEQYSGSSVDPNKLHQLLMTLYVESVNTQSI